MARDLQLETAVSSLKSAFKPLECAVEVFDGQHRVRFRVFDPEDKPLLTVEEVLARRLCDRGGLNTIVNECRARVQRKGYKLEPWAVPGAEERN